MTLTLIPYQTGYHLDQKDFLRIRAMQNHSPSTGERTNLLQELMINKDIGCDFLWSGLKEPALVFIFINIIFQTPLLFMFLLMKRLNNSKP